MSATPMRTEAADGARRGASAGMLKESGETVRESMLEPDETRADSCQQLRLRTWGGASDGSTDRSSGVAIIVFFFRMFAGKCGRCEEPSVPFAVSFGGNGCLTPWRPCMRNAVLV